MFLQGVPLQEILRTENRTRTLQNVHGRIFNRSVENLKPTIIFLA